jgi:hypothetical protein
VRAALDAQGDAVIYAIEAFYLQVNQAAIVTEVSVEPPPRPKTDKSARAQASGSTYKIKWKTENPDGDSLRFRLFYKEEQSSTWRALLHEDDVVTGTEQSWETEGIPDGYYRVRVEASDELDNPASFAEKHVGEAEPLLVDNHAPQVDSLRADKTKITGIARDSLGPITKLEYTVDGLDWKLFFPQDDIFDTAEEAFAVPFSLLPKGNHAIMIRAADARNNSATAEVVVDVP